LPGIIFPFLRFHPTLVPYLAPHLPADRRAELEERYWRGYYEFARYLYRADIQTPHQARAVAARELPNLRRALELAIEADAVAEAVMAQVAPLVGAMRATPTRTKAEYLMLSQQGEALLQQGRAAEAEQVFRGLLDKIEAGAAYETDEAAYDHAMTLARLGRCLAAQGRPAQAIPYHRRALEAFERISESANERDSESAKGMLGKVYTDLGDNLRAVGQFDEAQKAYESGLAVSREVNDHRAVGVHLGQLGNLALARGDLAEAARRHTEALETFRALGEP
jgi:tetratricopeptide (TPR) repeat protein